ncbi:hypothetical protein PT276_10725 [Orbaceae bacterium ESL0721]|nr:hypothetical protein [Orbaceae bacterium ESL0721]
MSTVLPLNGGVIIADYLLNHKHYQQLVNSNKKQINTVAIIAVIIGILCAQYLPGIIPLNSVLGSAISYIVIMLLLRKVTI